MRKTAGIFFLLLMLAWLSSARANGDRAPGIANETPAQLQGVGIEEHLGSVVDLTTPFVDDSGANVTLAKFFGRKPIILSMAYFGCPNLCSLHLNGMKDVFKQMPWTTGGEFDYVVVSINPNETAQLAAEKKANYVAAYGRPEGAGGWHFLSGREADIQKLAAQVGFKYRWDEKEQQYAHAAAAIVLTPQGKISRYLYGVSFEPKTVRLSLVEAANGQVGSVIDQLILFCFHYDPGANKYALAATRIMRAGGFLFLLVLAAFLLPFWLRHRRETVQGEG